MDETILKQLICFVIWAVLFISENFLKFVLVVNFPGDCSGFSIIQPCLRACNILLFQLHLLYLINNVVKWNVKQNYQHLLNTGKIPRRIWKEDQRLKDPGCWRSRNSTSETAEQCCEPGWVQGIAGEEYGYGGKASKCLTA